MEILTLHGKSARAHVCELLTPQAALWAVHAGRLLCDQAQSVIKSQDIQQALNARAFIASHPHAIVSLSAVNQS